MAQDYHDGRPVSRCVQLDGGPSEERRQSRPRDAARCRVASKANCQSSHADDEYALPCRFVPRVRELLAGSQVGHQRHSGLLEANLETRLIVNDDGYTIVGRCFLDDQARCSPTGELVPDQPQELDLACFEVAKA
jgi:hypothetical protein